MMTPAQPCLLYTSNPRILSGQPAAGDEHVSDRFGTAGCSFGVTGDFGGVLLEDPLAKEKAEAYVAKFWK